jgi:TusE/DsrC/DsvC family sulfur relay protein
MSESLLLKNIPRDPEGFLKNSTLWTPEIATALAESENIFLTEAHWFVINFLREYYHQHAHIPALRILIKLLKEKAPAFEINSQKLYVLFPDGPLKQGAKFSGLPKPPHCM